MMDVAAIAGADWPAHVGHWLGRIACLTTYNAGFVAALKARVPPLDREWEPHWRIWLIEPQHEALLFDLVTASFGPSGICLCCSAGTLCSAWREIDRRVLASGSRVIEPFRPHPRDL